MDPFDHWMDTIALPYVGLAMDPACVMAKIQWIQGGERPDPNPSLRTHLPNGMWRLALCAQGPTPYEHSLTSPLPTAHRLLALHTRTPAFFAGFLEHTQRFCKLLPTVKMVYHLRFIREDGRLHPRLDVGWDTEYPKLQGLPFGCRMDWESIVEPITTTFIATDLLERQRAWQAQIDQRKRRALQRSTSHSGPHPGSG